MLQKVMTEMYEKPLTTKNRSNMTPDEYLSAIDNFLESDWSILELY
jgi:hypothetical protein